VIKLLIEHTLLSMFPGLTWDQFEVFGDVTMDWQITRWDSEHPKPSKEQIIGHWEAHADAIVESARPKPVPDPLVILEQTQTDLIFQLMMAGVI
jgi:hypothetical protein